MERDPELYFPKPRNGLTYLFVLTGIPNAVRRIGDIVRLALGVADRPWMAPPERRPLIVEARVYAAAYLVLIGASVALASPVLLLVWIIPWLVGQAFLRPYLLAEHTGCAFTRDCSTTRAPRSRVSSCVSSRGTCRTTPSITRIPRCRSTRFPGSTPVFTAGSPTSSPGTSSHR